MCAPSSHMQTGSLSTVAIKQQNSAMLVLARSPVPSTKLGDKSTRQNLELVVSRERFVSAVVLHPPDAPVLRALYDAHTLPPHRARWHGQNALVCCGIGVPSIVTVPHASRNNATVGTPLVAHLLTSFDSKTSQSQAQPEITVPRDVLGGLPCSGGGCTLGVALWAGIGVGFRCITLRVTTCANVAVSTTFIAVCQWHGPRHWAAVRQANVCGSPCLGCLRYRRTPQPVCVCVCVCIVVVGGGVGVDRCNDSRTAPHVKKRGRFAP
jgi:hypothetical protein